MKAIKVTYKSESPISQFDIVFPDDVEATDEVSDPNEEINLVEKSKLDAAMEQLNRRFLHASESNLFIVPFIMSGLLGMTAKIVNKDLRELLENNGTLVGDDSGAAVYDLPLEEISSLAELLQKLNSAQYALDSYSRSLVIQLSTIFDILVSGLVEQIILLNPSVLEASERKIDLSDVSKFADIDHLRRHFYDKAVEAVVRKGRADQFKWIEGKLGIPLTKGLEGWTDFIEINERRNLFTHTEGWQLSP